mmetsp:Transcript_44522/g.79991  ORF Transcript_44522/g.79991 Transcript_44522/m.79991 type:complete len:233 (+) Transcript_44522:106-804(+)
MSPAQALTWQFPLRHQRVNFESLLPVTLQKIRPLPPQAMSPNYGAQRHLLGGEGCGVPTALGSVERRRLLLERWLGASPEQWAEGAEAPVLFEEHPVHQQIHAALTVQPVSAAQSFGGVATPPYLLVQVFESLDCLPGANPVVVKLVLLMAPGCEAAEPVQHDSVHRWQQRPRRSGAPGESCQSARTPLLQGQGSRSRASPLQLPRDWILAQKGQMRPKERQHSLHHVGCLS